jgi:hypothetical protein
MMSSAASSTTTSVLPEGLALAAGARRAAPHRTRSNTSSAGTASFRPLASAQQAGRRSEGLKHPEPTQSNFWALQDHTVPACRSRIGPRRNADPHPKIASVVVAWLGNQPVVHRAIGQLKCALQ